MPRPMPDDSAALYDEPELDQEGNMQADDEEKEDYGESFLAPKSAFKGDLSPGTIHRVRIEASHDEELELRCLGAESKGEPEAEGTPEQPDEMYE